MRPVEAKPRAKRKPGPKPKAAPPSAMDSGRVGGRQPSPASAACRSAVLLALLAAPAALSFTEIKAVIAPVMRKNGVEGDERLNYVMSNTQTVLKGKGYIERAAGAWKLTDVGRAEALRIRQAVKNAA